MIFQPPSSSDNSSLFAWAGRLVADFNRFHPTISRLPTFADDAAAAAGNLDVGQGYVTPAGIVRRRVA